MRRCTVARIVRRLTRHRRFALVMAALALGALCFGSDSNASSAALLQWDDASDFKTFGPNESVTIDLGILDFIGDCGGDGANDTFFAIGDIYVIPSGTAGNGSALGDVSGAANTVLAAGGGVFVSETIGFTIPSGQLGSGTYAVVYDECQNGTIDSEDAVFDPAFEVTVPTNVPTLPSPEIAALKARAGQQRLNWERAHSAYDWLFKIAGKVKYKGGLKDFVKTLMDMYGQIAKVFRLLDVKKAALITIAAEAAHYGAIEQDPPDPNFQQLTGLPARSLQDAQSDDPFIRDGVELGNQASSEDAITQALLHAIERYQGAEAANDGEWALIHAREIRGYALLLADQQAATNGGLATTSSDIAADARDPDAIATAWETFRSDVAASGLPAAAELELRNAGASPAQVDEVRNEILAEDMSGQSEAQIQSLLASFQSENSGLVTDLQSLAAAMNGIIAALEADPSAADEAPQADAGGPYAGSEGGAISFDGSGSTGRGGITAFEWDMDGDGAFDDATGASPAFTFGTPGSRLVGLLVTDVVGNQNVAFALVGVAATNAPPALDSVTPDDQIQTIEVGQTLAFSAAASDPDGGSPSLEWFVGDTSAATGTPFLYQPVVANLGVNLIEVVATDNHGASVRATWLALVALPDNDGDLWRPPADCNDANALVNPDRFEIEANGLDDDCDPSTADGGPPPPSLINSITKPDPGPSGRGSESSMELDANGFPIIAYRNNDNQLKLMHCNDINCAGQNESISTVNQGAASPSMKLDDDGFPVIVVGGSSAPVIHCNDASCLGSDESVNAAAPSLIGVQTALTLDHSGFPVVAFIEVNVFGTPGMRVVHCNDVNCAGNNESNELVFSCFCNPNVGPVAPSFPDIEIDDSGFPILSFVARGTSANVPAFHIMHCNDANCAGADESDQMFDDAATAQSQNALALDGNGNPVAFYRDNNLALRILHCDDPSCVGDPSHVVTTGSQPSLALDSSGLPVVGYYLAGGSQARVLRCNDVNCIGGDESVVVVDVGGGTMPSLKLDSFDHPVMAYTDGTGLKVVHCATVDCSTTPTYGRTFSRNLAAFSGNVCGVQTIIDFDSITAGTDIGGSTLQGVKFQAGNAPLIVVQGADTVTPPSFDTGPFVGQHHLIPTSGQNVLSPGGTTLGPGSNPSNEDDDLTVLFDPPVAAVGFDLLTQSSDGASATAFHAFDSEDHEFFSGSVPISQLGGTGSGSPAGTDFWGLTTPTAAISKIVIDEGDSDTSNPDSNVGYDTLRYVSSACASYSIPAPRAAPCTTGFVPTPYIIPYHYLSKADSPFLAEISAGSVYLEDFEDGDFDTPGLTQSGSITTAGQFLTDSVDGDDGVIDGSGLNGRDIFGMGTLQFDPNVLGGYPTRVGVVWTDGGQGATTTIEAFDPFGVSFGAQTYSFADNSITGETAEDCFVGVVHPGGISKLVISNAAGGIELDHIQYGFDLRFAPTPIPTPIADAHSHSNRTPSPTPTPTPTDTPSPTPTLPLPTDTTSPTPTPTPTDTPSPTPTDSNRHAVADAHSPLQLRPTRPLRRPLPRQPAHRRRRPLQLRTRRHAYSDRHAVADAHSDSDRHTVADAHAQPARHRRRPLPRLALRRLRRAVPRHRERQPRLRRHRLAPRGFDHDLQGRPGRLRSCRERGSVPGRVVCHLRPGPALKPSTGWPDGVLAATTWSAPISYNADIFRGYPGADANCVKYSGLVVGGNGYYYGRRRHWAQAGPRHGTTISSQSR